jgi:hypothetical protein
VLREPQLTHFDPKPQIIGTDVTNDSDSLLIDYLVLGPQSLIQIAKEVQGDYFLDVQAIASCDVGQTPTRLFHQMRIFCL